VVWPHPAEKKVRGQAPVIFGMAVLFVFLLLAAQYESWDSVRGVAGDPTVVLGTMSACCSGTTT